MDYKRNKGSKGIKGMKKIFVAPLLVGVIFMLVGCADNKSSEIVSKEKFTEDTVKDVALSKALPKYKIWYEFSGKDVNKKTRPSAMYYFDGKNIEKYDFPPYINISHWKIENDIIPLCIADILELNKEEQLKYARSRVETDSTRMLELGTEPEEISKKIEIGKADKIATTPYNINIITDGTGNNTEKMKLNVEKNWLDFNLDQEKYFWNIAKDILTVEPSYGINFTIYDHNLAGFNLSEGASFLLTDVKNKSVSFYLDAPDKETDIITID